MSIRKCVRCGCDIHCCFGFVKNSDFAELLEGKRVKKDVRELCGKCVFIIERTFKSSEHYDPSVTERLDGYTEDSW